MGQMVRAEGRAVVYIEFSRQAPFAQGLSQGVTVGFDSL